MIVGDCRMLNVLWGMRMFIATFTLHLLERKSKPSFDEHVIAPRFICQDRSKVKNGLTDEVHEAMILPFLQVVLQFLFFRPIQPCRNRQKCHIHLARHGDSWCIMMYPCSLPDLTVKAYPPRRGKTWVGGRGGELDEGAGAETRIGWMLQQVGGVSCPWWDMAVEQAVCLWWFHRVRFHMFHWVLVLQWFEEPLILSNFI